MSIWLEDGAKTKPAAICTYVFVCICPEDGAKIKNNLISNKELLGLGLEGGANITYKIMCLEILHEDGAQIKTKIEQCSAFK